MEIILKITENTLVTKHTHTIRIVVPTIQPNMNSSTNKHTVLLTLINVTRCWC